MIKNLRNNCSKDGGTFVRILKFGSNWNGKLDKREFTTVRAYTEEKIEYYAEAVKQPFSILLRNRSYCTAWLQAVEPKDHLSDLGVPFLMDDTGMKTEKDAYDLFARFGMKPEDPAILLRLIRPEIKQVELYDHQGTPHNPSPAR